MPNDHDGESVDVWVDGEYVTTLGLSRYGWPTSTGTALKLLHMISREHKVELVFTGKPLPNAMYVMVRDASGAYSSVTVEHIWHAASVK